MEVNELIDIYHAGCRNFGGVNLSKTDMNRIDLSNADLRYQEVAARRLSISLTKHSLSLALAFTRVLSKFLTRLLHLSTQALLLSTIQRIGITTRPDIP